MGGKNVCILIMVACLAGCQERKKKIGRKEEGVETVLPELANEVTIMKLKKQVFSHELVSNGKIQACEYAHLSFRTVTEPLAKVYVKNGDRVVKGQKIAELNLFTLENKLAQAKNAPRVSLSLEMQDVLIGQGYAPDRPESVPEEM